MESFVADQLKVLADDAGDLEIEIDLEGFAPLKEPGPWARAA